MGRPKSDKKSEPKKILDKKVANRLLLFIYLLVLIISFFHVYGSVFDEKINLGGDNAGYYILGNAIASGQGFTNIHTKEKAEHTHFPPGYPAIIAAISKVYNNDIQTIKKANGMFLLLSIGLLFFILSEITGNYHIPFVTSLLSLLNVNLLGYSVIMMSEIPFLFFSLLCIWLAMKIDFDKPFYKNWLFLLLILDLSLVFYIRSAGLALLVGIGLYLAFNKKWKYVLALFTGFFLTMLPWYLRNKSVGAGSYLHVLVSKNPYRPELGLMGFSDWFTRIGHNFQRYLTREIPSSTFNFIHITSYKNPISTSEWILGIIIIAVMIFGLFRIKKYFLLILFYMSAYMGILLLWPEVWYGVRFILPLVPLMTFLFVNGIYELLTLLGQKVLKIEKASVMQIAMVILLLLVIKPYSSEAIVKLERQAKGSYPNKYKNYFELAKWVKNNTPENSVTCCRKGQLFFLFSNKYVTGYKNTLDTEDQINFLKEKGVDYVVLEQLGFASTGRYLLPAIKKYPEKFQVVQHLKNPDTFLMKFRPDLGYTGEWKDGKKNGQGTFVWNNNRRFEGEFKNDLRNGKGTLIFPNGNQLEGTWKNDTLVGPTTLKSKDGEIIQKAIYKDNKLVRVLSQK